VNWLAKTIGALMPNCREALRLQSDALDRPLSRWQRVGLRFHLLLCKWCRRYGRQIAFLRTAAHGCEDVHAPEQKLPLEARERIKQALKSGKNSPD
jgi:hypothetical protein